MNIFYSSEKNIPLYQLKNLYDSVNWSSGKYPDKLTRAIANYSTVYTAWNGDTLVGLISVMDDGELNAYIHYLLVRPDYQRMGIGSTLVKMVKKQYYSYINLILVSYKSAVPFYMKLGFKGDNESQALYFTSQ